MRLLCLIIFALLLTGLNGCAGRTPPASTMQTGQCLCECDPARGSYSYSTATQPPFDTRRGIYRGNTNAVGGVALPPVVTPRFQGSRGSPMAMADTTRSRTPSTGNATGQYNQARIDAQRSAKRRAAARKRTTSRGKTRKSKVDKTKKTHRRSSTHKKTHHRSSANKKTHHKDEKKKKTNKKAGRSYKVLGEWYTPLATSQGYDETGKASWYGKRFHGGPTASGEKFDMNALTAAHKTLPFNSKARVTNLDTNSSIIVRINDRGPFRKGYVIDVSAAAADRLGFNGKGTIKVRVEGVE